MFLSAILGVSVIKGLFSFIMIAGIMSYFAWNLIANSDDPKAMIKKLIYTAILLGMLVGFLIKMFGIGATGAAGGAADYATAMVIAGGAAAFGLILAMLWGTEIGGWIAKPFENLYTGGGAELERQPFYAIAEAKRKRGDYNGAIAAIRGQLEQFPNDFRGTMMLADIQAENLKDLAGAEQTIEILLAETQLPAQSLSFALSRLADWQLSMAQNPDAARIALERITQLCPETEQAMLAYQRIAHLATAEELTEQKERRKIQLVKHEEHIGLRRDFEKIKIEPKVTPTEAAAKLVAHLQDHPYDNDAREELALLYAQEFNRPDLAIGELEQLIAAPHQIHAQVVRWLKLPTHLHLKAPR